MATLGVNITYSNYRMNENDRTVTATITFNQPIRPDSFNLASLYNIEGYRARFTPSNLTAVAGSNNTQWTVTLTPDAGIDGQYGKISLWLGSIRDANGNLGPGQHGTSGDVMVDNVKPRLESAVFADSTLTIGETTTVTLTFSENVRDYGVVWLTSKSIDMSGSNCTLVSIEPADTGFGGRTARIYILTIRPNENVQSSSNNVIRVKHDQMGDEANNRPAADTNLSSGTFTVDTKRPTLEAATVTGDQLVLRYDEALNGDAARKPAATAFSVTGSSGEAITVTGVGVDAATRTVTLTLSRAAKNGETVTVNYTAPAVNHGNGNDAIQDAAGNDAVGLTNQAVTNATPPLCSGATVNGNKLVLSFADAAGLDGAAAPAATAFSVSGNITVTAVAVDAAAKTVTLTLSRPAAYGEQVSVTYTDPAGNQTTGVIQDTAGNDVATFTQQTVVNKTPPAHNRATVVGDKLVLRYDQAEGLDADPSHKPANTAFSVTGSSGTAITVTEVNVDAATKTVTLTLSRPVVNGETVLVNYTDPAGDGDNGIQDTNGLDVASFTAASVVNKTPPLCSGATADGNLLVLSFAQANGLDGVRVPGNDAFTVTGADNERIAVRGVNVNATAKTVTLTLERAVAHGEQVSVSYTDPTPNTGVDPVAGDDTNVLQDAAGNDVSSFTSAVTNQTPPVCSGATANGDKLVLSFAQATGLDAANGPAATAFRVTGSATGAAITVTAVVVDAAAKTVTLTLSRAAAYDEPLSVTYTDPTAGNDRNAIQDAAGNDVATFTRENVTNKTPPVHNRATVVGDQLALRYDQAEGLGGNPTPGLFRVTGAAGGAAITVTAVKVDAATKTVVLTLSRPAANGETVTVSYTDPAGDGNDGVQDANGYDVASFTAAPVVNKTAPVYSRATVNGDKMVLRFEQATGLDADPAHKPAVETFDVRGADGARIAVTAVTVNAATKTVELTLARAVAHNERVTVTYTDPTPNSGADPVTGDDTNALQDAAGNDVNTFTVPSTSMINKTPPVHSGATVNGKQLVIRFDQANGLEGDPAKKPAPGAFVVTVGADNERIGVSAVSVDAASKTVTLTLIRPVALGETVRVSYTDPTTNSGTDPVTGDDTSGVIQDAAGNDVSSFTTTVTNDTPPVYSSATVNGDQLVLSFARASGLDGDPDHAPLPGAFDVRDADGTRIAVTAVSVNAAAKTVTLTLARAVTYRDTLSVSYTDPTPNSGTDPAVGNDLKAIQDETGYDMGSFRVPVVTNLSPAPTPPVTTPTTPAKPDRDGDGVPDADEGRSVGPNGADGDGNGDGISDSEQSAVGSVGGTTLVVGSQDGKVGTDNQSRITSLEQKTAPAQLPKGMEMPIGLLNFSTTLTTAGSTESFSVYVDPDKGTTGYWVQDRTGTWVNLASEPYGGKMVTEGNRLRLDFQIEDGGQFDTDGEVNGQITTSGAAAHMQLSIVGSAPDVVSQGFWL
ncbi:SwmB domain-containing protein [Verminephrobacter eiseniae]|nr:SwmB domain-containing protein [Verminephrobacter eiseniae]